MAQDYDVAYDFFTRDPGAMRFGRPGNRQAFVVDSDGNLTITGDMSIAGALALIGALALSGALTIGGALTVNGYTTLQSAQANGDFATFGDLSMVAAGGGINIKEGADATMGAATMVAGTVTVNTNKVTANSRIFLTRQNSSGTVGFLGVSARVAATSFTISSSNVLDTSTVAWIIVEPAP